MPDPKVPTASEPVRPDDVSPLELFLRAFDAFIQQTTNLSVHAAPKGESQDLIKAIGDSLVGQSNKLTAFTRELAERLSPAQHLEMNQFLRIQDGEAMATRSVEVAAKLLSTGVFGKLGHWLVQHLIELKKLFKALLRGIFKWIGIPWYDWLEEIFIFIDELFNHEQTHLAAAFGLDFSRTAREFSELEVNYLHEMAALEAMRAARGRADADES